MLPNYKITLISNENQLPRTRRAWYASKSGLFIKSHFTATIIQEADNDYGCRYDLSLRTHLQHFLFGTLTTGIKGLKCLGGEKGPKSSDSNQSTWISLQGMLETAAEYNIKVWTFYHHPNDCEIFRSECLYVFKSCSSKTREQKLLKQGLPLFFTSILKISALFDIYNCMH